MERALLEGAPARVPAAYRDGHAAARLVDAAAADRYVAHTMVGDPLADAAVASLAGHDGARQSAWIGRCLAEGDDAGAPDALRALMAEAAQPPDWFDPALTLAGCRAFHRNSEMFIGAFVAAVLIEGFATLIGKSFAITGRLVDQGVRRLKQNNRHLVEVFMPGGLDRGGEGWRLSLRIRLVHARVRLLLSRSAEWDAAAWGTPLSAAHIGFATAAFSALLLDRVRLLGVELSAQERQSFMLTWRYTGHLMGVPAALSCAGEAEALHLYRIGALCEPPPDIESILLANGLINAAPIVAGISQPAQRRALVRRIYAISRAIIGDARADQLRFPPARSFGVLAALRWRNRLDRLLARLLPGLGRRRQAGRFLRMLDLSYHGADGAAAAEIGYRLPAELHAEKERSG